MSILTVLLDRDLPKSPPQSARSVDEGEEVVGCLGGAQQVGEVTAAPSKGYNVLVSCKGEARAGEKEMVDSLMLFAASRAVGCQGALDAVEVLKERGVSSAQLDEGTEERLAWCSQGPVTRRKNACDVTPKAWFGTGMRVSTAPHCLLECQLKSSRPPLKAARTHDLTEA